MKSILFDEPKWLQKAYWVRKPKELETVLVVKIWLNRVLIVHFGARGEEYLICIPKEQLILTEELVPPPCLKGKLLSQAKF